ncbi:MAG TPA: hypothetical protein VNC50_15925 [Planctomycetia bacterium]|nr:hypothetical protein [Planctomycetia bacterium]
MADNPAVVTDAPITRKEDAFDAPTPWLKSAIRTFLMVVALVFVWIFFTRAPDRLSPSSDAVIALASYQHEGKWVFDDSAVKAKREPFFTGAPAFMDALVKDVPNAEKGVRIRLSAKPFPGHQKKLTWVRGDATVNYYKLADPPIETTVGPVLARYYEAPPEELYVKVEPIQP